MKPIKTVACVIWSKHDGNECIGVYEIWERSDGFCLEAYKFDDMEDYNAYEVSDDMPYNISHELGLCENYHNGI